MRVDGFGAVASLVIIAVLLYMAYNFGKNGKLFGGG